jgi:cysteine synthase
VKPEVKQWACTLKYRVVQRRLEQALEDGSLRPNTPLLTASSGASAVALAFAGQLLGLPVEILADASMPQSYRQRILSYRAGLVEHPRIDDAAGRQAEIERRAGAQQGWILPLDERPPRRSAYRDLGIEIAAQLVQMGVHQLQALVCPVRSGALLQGVGTYLNGVFPDLKMVAIDPADSRDESGLKLEDPDFPDELLSIRRPSHPSFVQGVPLGENGSAAWEAALARGGEGVLVLSPD